MAIKKVKYISGIWIFVLFLFLSRAEVSAQDKRGSIHLYLQSGEILETGQTITFAVKKVADMINGEFVLKKTYAEAEVDVNQIKYGEEPKKTAYKLKKIDAKADLLIQIGEDGQGGVDDLSAGMYLVYPYGTDESGEDLSEWIQPSLVAIPREGDQGEMLYDLQVYPKQTAKEKETTVKTGDENTLIYYCLFMAGAVLLALLSLYRIYRHGRK